MLPLDRLYSNDTLCFNGDFETCPIYIEQGRRTSTGRKVCPYLEVDTVIYCEVYPVKKMIPSSAFRLETPCTTNTFTHCPTYQRISWGDLPTGQSRRLTSVQGVMIEDGVYYDDRHTWLQPVNGTVRVGMDDFAQRLLGSIDQILPPSKGKKVKTGRILMKVRCGDRLVKLRSPVSGQIISVNAAVVNDTTSVNADPYGRGWLVEVKPDSEEAPWAGIMHYGPDAASWMEEEIVKLHRSIQSQVGLTMGDGGLVTANVRAALAPTQWDRAVTLFLEKRRA